MSANVETMFSVREVPWHGLGNIIEEAVTSADAIKQAGLDWEVIPKPIYIENNEEFSMVPNMFANVRSDNNKSLGVVSGRYNLVQNREAFDFVDTLLGNNDVRYETAGSLAEGKRVWMLAHLKTNARILGDKVENYLVLTNAHDGKGAIKVACTPVRVVCQNTLNIALAQASRSWTTKHTGNFQSKIIEAQATLDMAHNYIEALSAEAEELVKKIIPFKTFRAITEELFPINTDNTTRQIKTVKAMREGLEFCFQADDIRDFRETGWGVVNAVSDFVGHRQAKRMTSTYEERRFQSVIDGSTVFDRAYQLVKSA